MVVVGGGDTGSDCIGTSIRQGALSVTNFEIMQRPPDQENKLLTWPDWPLKLRTLSSHEEGVARDFAVLSQEFVGENGAAPAILCVSSEFRRIFHRNGLDVVPLMEQRGHGTRRSFVSPK